MIKSILLIFDGFQEELNALNAALALGKEHDATVTVLHISEDATSSGLVYDGIAISVLAESIERENKIRLDQARRHIISYADRHHLSLYSADTKQQHASVTFIHKTGSAEHFISREGRLHDLIVVAGHPDFRELAVSALFTTGRPVIVMPRSKELTVETWHNEVALCAWKDTLEASRAVMGAIPLLKRAKKVYVVTANPSKEAEGLERLQKYLISQEIFAEIVDCQCNDNEAGKEILDQASKLKADFIVMGAYGHSRIQEMVFGGVTRHMLEKTGKPLLMAH